MRLNRFDLNLLLALDALLRERSVTRAAVRLYVSQPAMSAALAKLRDYFRDPLLVRVGRDLELTPRGRSLREPVQRMLQHAQSVLGSQALFDPSTEKRTFRILCPDYVSPWVMPAILQRMERWAPGMRVEVQRPSASALASLGQGDFDLLLAIDAPESLSLPALPESLCSAFVVDLRYMCLVSIAHPEITDSLTREQFLRLPHIIVRFGGQFSLIEDYAHAHLNASLDVRAMTENVLELPFLILGTPYLAVTMEPLTRPLRSSARLRIIELPDGVMPTSRLDMLWHRSFQSDPGHAWLRGIILNECMARPEQDVDIW
jgi:LysR family nod box-dependent transcriptional activator